MRNRSIIRLASLALLFTALAATRLAAQGGVIAHCTCKYISITVDAKVACKVNVVVIYPGQLSPIVTVAPGTSVQVPCEDGCEVTLVDCHNHKNQLDATGCLFNFPADVGCCVNACLGTDAKGCPELVVRAAQGPCPC